MSQRFASDTMRSAFSSPIAAVTLPGTTVIARTSSSGEFSANIRASASSLPGSVSMMIFFAARAGDANKAATISNDVREQVNLNEREAASQRQSFMGRMVDAVG